MPAGTCEPTRIGGRGDRIGRGRIVTFSRVQCRPRWVTLSSVHSRRMISTPSARRLTRSGIGTPKIANSSGRYPSPTPSRNRPPVSTSRKAPTSAISTGLCSGSSTRLVPISSPGTSAARRWSIGSSGK